MSLGQIDGPVIVKRPSVGQPVCNIVLAESNEIGHLPPGWGDNAQILSVIEEKAVTCLSRDAMTHPRSL